LPLSIKIAGGGGSRWSHCSFTGGAALVGLGILSGSFHVRWSSSSTGPFGAIVLLALDANWCSMSDLCSEF